MVAVASGAGGSGQVAARERLVVHAGAVLIPLVGWNLVPLHALPVRVAAGTGSGQPKRMDARQGGGSGANVVDAVAVRTDRHAGVAAPQAPAMHAGSILSQLVGAQPGVVGAHESGIGVAVRAQARDVSTLGHADESFGGVHGLIGIFLARVAAVAGGASEAAGGVDVAGEQLRGHAQVLVVLEDQVAIETSVGGQRRGRRLRPQPARSQRQEEQNQPAARPHPSYPHHAHTVMPIM